jgi:citrate lyase subunit beta/citryl-CoA lyase
MEGAGIRSLLFAPGDSEAKASKALASSADAVILDLEDAVAPEAKSRARQQVRELLDNAPRGDRAVFVRINALDSGLAADDLAATVAGKPWGIMVPKCGSLAEIDRLDHQLDVLEARDGIERGSTRILVIGTETAGSTLDLILARGPVTRRLWGVMWGSEDLAASLGAENNRDADGKLTLPYQMARSHCLYAAATLGVAAVDAVHLDFRDSLALAMETRHAVRDGFTAKAAIHPAQLDVINSTLTPADEQIAWARQVDELLANDAVARLDGRMIDLAHKRIAVRILARAAAIQTRPAGVV